MPIVALREPHDVIAVVPTMGGNLPRLRRCLDSVLATASDTRLAVLCVVNNSTGLSAEFDRAQIGVLEAGVNLGWAGGLILGAGESESPYIWFIQDDMTVEESTLTALVATLESDATLGSVGPVYVDAASGLVPMGSCGGVVAATGNVADFLPATACAPEDLPPLDGLSYIPSRGLLVRREAFTASGGPNPRLYPVQFVDVDFGHRLRTAGWAKRLDTSARIHHDINGSSPAGFVHFLYSRNVELFAHDWVGPEAHPIEPFYPVAVHRPDAVTAARVPLHPRISPELTTAVIQSAADSLTHLGRVFSAMETELATREAELRDAQSESFGLRQQIQAMVESRWWRLARPLRSLSDRLRRVRHPAPRAE